MENLDFLRRYSFRHNRILQILQITEQFNRLRFDLALLEIEKSDTGKPNEVHEHFIGHFMLSSQDGSQLQPVPSRPTSIAATGCQKGEPPRLLNFEEATPKAGHLSREPIVGPPACSSVDGEPQTLPRLR